jgi:hypothetical protein
MGGKSGWEFICNRYRIGVMAKGRISDFQA